MADGRPSTPTDFPQAEQFIREDIEPKTLNSMFQLLCWPEPSPNRLEEANIQDSLAFLPPFLQPFLLSWGAKGVCEEPNLVNLVPEICP